MKGKIGYRYGHFQTQLESRLFDGTFLFSDSVTLRALNFIQTELEADLFLMNHLFLRGEGGYGWLLSGYNNEDSVTKVFTRKAHLHEGSIGFGALSLNALCMPCKGLKLGPSYGFYFQEFAARTINGNTYIYPNNLEEVEYISRWRAPRWGVLAQCKAWNVLFEASYTYASSNWQGNWRVKGWDLPEELFSEKRSARASSGHFVRLKCDQVLSRSWRIGCDIGYEFLSAKKGVSQAESEEKQAAMKLEQIVDLVPKVSWTSLSALIEIGYLF